MTELLHGNLNTARTGECIYNTALVQLFEHHLPRMRFRFYLSTDTKKNVKRPESNTRKPEMGWLALSRWECVRARRIIDHSLMHVTMCHLLGKQI